jgi:hypothetical protein
MSAFIRQLSAKLTCNGRLPAPRAEGKHTRRHVGPWLGASCSQARWSSRVRVRLSHLTLLAWSRLPSVATSQAATSCRRRDCERRQRNRKSFWLLFVIVSKQEYALSRSDVAARNNMRCRPANVVVFRVSRIWESHRYFTSATSDSTELPPSKARPRSPQLLSC